MKYYVVDAFTDHVFGGGPAAVCINETCLDDEVMQNIAMENNLADTAFLVKNGDDYDLRWFMPKAEIDLNGHATLAAAYALFRFIEPSRKQVTFHTKSGALTVKKDGDWLEMDFPAVEIHPIAGSEEMTRALGAQPQEVYLGANPVFVYEHAADIASLSPDFAALRAFPQGQGVFVTAPGEEGYDFAARAFWPKMGVDEDPVCGNMHCHLIPFWAQRLGKTELISHQLSPRGAVIRGVHRGARVTLKGQAALFAVADIYIK